jgi:hypothetical protein
MFAYLFLAVCLFPHHGFHTHTGKRRIGLASNPKPDAGPLALTGDPSGKRHRRRNADRRRDEHYASRFVFIFARRLTDLLAKPFWVAGWIRRMWRSRLSSVSKLLRPPLRLSYRNLIQTVSGHVVR